MNHAALRKWNEGMTGWITFWVKTDENCVNYYFSWTVADVMCRFRHLHVFVELIALLSIAYLLGSFIQPVDLSMQEWIPRNLEVSKQRTKLETKNIRRCVNVMCPFYSRATFCSYVLEQKYQSLDRNIVYVCKAVKLFIHPRKLFFYGWASVRVSHLSEWFSLEKSFHSMDLPPSTKTSKAISSFIIEARASGQKVIGGSDPCARSCGPLFLKLVLVKKLLKETSCLVLCNYGNFFEGIFFRN